MLQPKTLLTVTVGVKGTLNSPNVISKLREEINQIEDLAVHCEKIVEHFLLLDSFTDTPADGCTNFSIVVKYFPKLDAFGYKSSMALGFKLSPFRDVGSMRVYTPAVTFDLPLTS